KTAVFGLIIGVIACFEGMRAGRHGRRGALRYQLGGTFFALYHSGRCSAGPADHCVLLVRACMEHMEPNHNEPPIVVTGLTKSFGSQKVLDGIDLAVAHGETVAVLGRSG